MYKPTLLWLRYFFDNIVSCQFCFHKTKQNKIFQSKNVSLKVHLEKYEVTMSLQYYIFLHVALYYIKYKLFP